MEADRLRALHNAQILDTDYETSFDSLVELAAYICATPTSAVTFIDTDRQWFKAKKGVPERETPLNVSFCQHVVAENRPIVMPDARLDPRVAAYPNVTTTPGVRFYAGFPLHDPEGYALGTLCVFDQSPRTLAPEQERALRTLAAQAEAQLQLRKVAVDLRDALEQVKTLREMIPMCAWCRKVRDDKEFWHNVEVYLRDHAGVAVSHGICPECFEKASQ
jgi:GAF domain-containing protein